MSVSLLRSMINHIIISHLHFGSIFFQAPHPLFYVVGCGGEPGQLCGPVGTLWSPGLSSLFHKSICNGSVTFLYSIYSCFYLCCSTGPIFWACQAESDIHGISQRNPPLSDHLPKNKIASPGSRTTALVICSSRQSWNMSAINKPLHVWEGGG